jgi:dihydrodipicolinate synthase/N-acetylneuraminate lyase
MIPLNGHFAPIITPLTDDGSGISEVRLNRVIHRVVDLGVQGFVVGSETGEVGALSFGERKEMVELVVRATQGRHPVLVNVSSMNTSASLDLAQHAMRHGARAIVLTPPQGHFEAREVTSHFRTVIHYSQAACVAIDPEGLLTAEAIEQLSSAARFEVAAGVGGGPPRCDRFQFGDLHVSPAYHFTIVKMPELEELLDRYNGAKVVKGLYTEMDFEMGPVRQPLLALDMDEAMPVLKALIQPSD